MAFAQKRLSLGPCGRAHTFTHAHTHACARTHAHTCHGTKPEWGLARGGMSFLEAGGLPAPKATGQVATRGRAWRPARTELSSSDHHSDPGHIHGDLQSQWLPCPMRSVRGQRHPTGGGQTPPFFPEMLGLFFLQAHSFPVSGPQDGGGTVRLGPAWQRRFEKPPNLPPPKHLFLPPPQQSAPWPQGPQLAQGSQWGRERMVQGQP